MMILRAPYPMRHSTGRSVSTLTLLAVWGVLLCSTAFAARRHNHGVAAKAERVRTSFHTASRGPVTTNSRAYLSRSSAHLSRSQKTVHALRATYQRPVRTFTAHRHRLHTASRLHHARSHGTAALQAAAHEAQIESAQEAIRNEPAANQQVNTASLYLPQIPMHPMNLPPMRGTRESLVRQNQRADQEGLARIQDDADITALLHHGLLVSLPTANGLHADPRLPENRRYCRPFTARFLADLSRAYYARFHTGLQVNSAVRTVEYQRHLLRVNGNAAPADGDIASPHLTGATIDIAKKGLSPIEVEWMRSYLSPLERAGKVDVEEEFYQSCFHISVYQSYAGAGAESASISHHVPLLATGLR